MLCCADCEALFTIYGWPEGCGVLCVVEFDLFYCIYAIERATCLANYSVAVAVDIASLSFEAGSIPFDANFLLKVLACLFLFPWECLLPVLPPPEAILPRTPIKSDY